MSHDPERIARHFHETYERLAPEHGYVTRRRTRTKWEEIPSGNKSLMIATVAELIERGVIRGTP